MTVFIYMLNRSSTLHSIRNVHWQGMGDIYTIQFYRSFYSLSLRNVLTFWFSAEQEEEESPKIPPVENVSVEKGVESAAGEQPVSPPDEAGESPLVSEEKTEPSPQEESTEEPSTKHQDDGKWSNFFPKYTHFNRI